MENRRAMGREPGEETPPGPHKGAFPKCCPNTQHRLREAQLPPGNAAALEDFPREASPQEESQENHMGKLNFLQKTQPVPIPPWGKLLVHVLSSWPGQEETKDALGAGAPGFQEDPSPSRCPGEILHEFGPQNIKDPINLLLVGVPV